MKHKTDMDRELSYNFKFIATLALLVYLSWAGLAQAATLSLSPATGVYGAGDTFIARVVVNTSGQSVNAADGTLTFNPSELQVIGISKGSIFNLWTAEPAFSNTAGTITFSGGNPTGYRGSAGTVISVTFRVVNAGTAKANFTSGSVLAADGLGTNVLTNMNGGTYTVAAVADTPTPEVIEYVAPANTPGAPVVTSTSHPDPDGWSRETTAELTWKLPAGVTGVRTLLDSAPSTIPNKVYDTPISDITIEDLEPGEQYFHLQFRNEDGWGAVTHYRLAVDLDDPTDFSISLAEDADPTSPDQTLLLAATDTTSVVRRYIVQVDGGEPYEFIDTEDTGELILSDLEPGYHSVIIEAFDEAGNSVISTFSFTVASFDKPQFTEYPTELSDTVIPVLRGITRPRAQVTISVARVGEAAETYEVTADDGGVFTFIPANRFSTGVYEITAVAIDQHGAQSEPSDPIRLAVQQPGYIQIGSWLISLLSVIIPLLVLVVALGVLLWYLWFYLRRLRGGVSRETREALNMVDKEFKRLATTLDTASQDLAATRKSKQLTKSEGELVGTVAESLEEARQRVRKEVKDVDEIISKSK